MRGLIRVLDELDRLHCARQADPPTKSATFCARHAPRHAAGCTIADAIVRFSASLPVPFPSPLFSLTFPSKPGLLTRPRGFRTALGALMAACSYALVPGGKSLTLRSVWLEPHTSHVHGPVHFAIEARVSAILLAESQVVRVTASGELRCGHSADLCPRLPNFLFLSLVRPRARLDCVGLSSSCTVVHIV